MAQHTSPKIRSLPTDRRVKYPESDGKPMAETDFHRTPMTDLIEILTERYKEHPDVYVSGNLFLHDQPGKPRKKPVAPDVFVAFGVKKKKRRNYLLCEEGKGPDWVLEVVSRGTFRRDLSEKKDLYATAFGVKEYVLYDPDHKYLPSPLIGYRLEGGNYIPIQPVENRLPSEVLGLELGEAEGELRFYDPLKREWVLKPAEHALAQAQHALAQAQQEAQARQQAEAQAQQEAQARQRAEARAQQAETRAQQAESELARLRAELERLRAAKS